MQCGDDSAWQQLLKEATDNMQPLAQAYVAICFDAPWISLVPNDSKLSKLFGNEALSWLLFRASKDCNFGRTYAAALGFHKICTGMDAVQCWLMLSKAVEEEFADAYFWLAACNFEGFGVDSSVEECLRLLEKAASRGLLNACFVLSKLLQSPGTGVELDNVKAANLLDSVISSKFHAAVTTVISYFQLWCSFDNLNLLYIAFVVNILTFEILCRIG